MYTLLRKLTNFSYHLHYAAFFVRFMCVYFENQTSRIRIEISNNTDSSEESIFIFITHWFRCRKQQKVLYIKHTFSWNKLKYIFSACSKFWLRPWQQIWNNFGSEFMFHIFKHNRQNNNPFAKKSIGFYGATRPSIWQWFYENRFSHLWETWVRLNSLHVSFNNFWTTSTISIKFKS